MINRLRAVMTSVFPSLEREYDYSSCQGALVLLTGYATPQQIRGIGLTRLTSWLQRRRARNFAQVAARAVAAAQSQHTMLPGQHIAASRCRRHLRQPRIQHVSEWFVIRQLNHVEAGHREITSRYAAATVTGVSPGVSANLSAETRHDDTSRRRGERPGAVIATATAAAAGATQFRCRLPLSPEWAVGSKGLARQKIAEGPSRCSGVPDIGWRAAEPRLGRTLFRRRSPQGADAP